MSSAKRVGRVAGIVVFATIVTVFTAVCSVEIIIQAWAMPDAPAPGAAPATPR
ncbi:MAG TPA: hypothetical protein VHE30_27175 [Polyangiaceae bacterium]|nr:hypothetical protein [Polyangiaceae bacterium]